MKTLKGSQSTPKCHDNLLENHWPKKWHRLHWFHGPRCIVWSNVPVLSNNHITWMASVGSMINRGLQKCSTVLSTPLLVSSWQKKWCPFPFEQLNNWKQKASKPSSSKYGYGKRIPEVARVAMSSCLKSSRKSNFFFKVFIFGAQWDTVLPK